MSLFDEFRRGTVWKVASVYVASSWGVVGIVDFATDQVGNLVAQGVIAELDETIGRLDEG